jgi:hypothetical protein
MQCPTVALEPFEKQPIFGEGDPRGCARNIASARFESLGSE